MSSAPRPARWNTRSRSCAGQPRLLGQRMSISPSLAGASGEPHSGQWVGIWKARSVPSRMSTTGLTISGMTSPALRTTTVSPIRTPLRATSCALCRVANVTVEPATRTGLSSAYGVTRPVRPTLTLMSTSLVFTSSGGYLKAIDHRPALAGRQAPGPQRLVGLALPAWLEAAPRAHAVHHQAERPGRADPRILLPQAAGGRAAGVGERRLPLLDQ